MYEALVARIRYHIQKANFMGLKDAESTLLLGEAADAIEELTGFVQEAERDRDEYRERLDKANDAIEELGRDLDSMNEANIALYGALPKWIPVAERLPKEDGRYLVSYPLFNVKAWMRVAYFSTNLYYVDRYAFPGKGNKRPGFYYSDDEYGDVELQDITHWMPLPEPPKEEP